MSTSLGIALGALGSVAINTGNNLQSLGMAKLEKAAAEARAAKCRVQTLATISASGLESGEAISAMAACAALERQPGDDDSVSGDGAPEEPAEELDTCQSPIWVVGTVVFISGSLLNFAAFAFAPQSILASLEGIQFVTNVLFGKFVLNSTVRPGLGRLIICDGDLQRQFDNPVVLSCGG